ncbi:MAG: DUF2513 domain-containing protein, partial [Proteobacteria bacterium]|nr:DUF2513 domain-containing protein [Pseudomonadota bacterium]
ERLERGHLLVLYDLGYAVPVGNATFRLTAAGHEFIETMRQDSVWQQAKNQVAETGGSATLEILKRLGTALIRKKIEEYTGLTI